MRWLCGEQHPDFDLYSACVFAPFVDQRAADSTAGRLALTVRGKGGGWKQYTCHASGAGERDGALLSNRALQVASALWQAQSLQPEAWQQMLAGSKCWLSDLHANRAATFAAHLHFPGSFFIADMAGTAQEQVSGGWTSYGMQDGARCSACIRPLLPWECTLRLDSAAATASLQPSMNSPPSERFPAASTSVQGRPCTLVCS